MADPTPTRAGLLAGLRVQFRSIHSLIIRDMMLRYGRDNIGFLWVVIEPLILTAGVLIMYSQIKSGYEHGTHVISMVLTGYMPLTMWRHTSNNGVFLLRRSLGVLYHRNISLLDVFLARMLLEGIGTTAALTMVFGVLWAFDVIETVAKPGHLIAAWVLLWWLGTSVALILAGMTEANEATERLVQPLQYMVVPLSGIFFMVDWMPQRMQQVMLYNPLTNCIEFFRDGFFGDRVTTHYDVGYAVTLALVFTWIGLALLTRARDSLSSA